MSAETQNRQIQNESATKNGDHHNIGGIHIGGKDFSKTSKANNPSQNERVNEDHHKCGGVFVGGADKSKEYGTESKNLEENSSEQGLLGNAFQTMQNAVGSVIPNALKPSSDHHNTGGVHVGGSNYGTISYNEKTADASKKTLKEKNQEKSCKTSEKDANKKGNTGGYHVEGDNHDDIVYNDGSNNGQQSNL